MRNLQLPFQAGALILFQLMRQLLIADGLIIYESGSRGVPPELAGTTITRQKIMGDTQVTFYKIEYEKDSNLSRNV